MIQYLINSTYEVYTKDGSLKKVRDVRKRVRYNNNEIFIASLFESEELRADRMAERLTSGALNVGDIIDVNEEDVFSLSVGDTLYYHKVVS